MTLNKPIAKPKSSRRFYNFEGFIRTDSLDQQYLAIDDMIAYMNEPFQCPHCQQTDCWPADLAMDAHLGAVMMYAAPCQRGSKPRRRPLGGAAREDKAVFEKDYVGRPHK